MTYCPLCGREQKKDIYGAHTQSNFAWSYEFTCEYCNHIITFDDWGWDYTNAPEDR